MTAKESSAAVRVDGARAHARPCQTVRSERGRRRQSPVIRVDPASRAYEAGNPSACDLQVNQKDVATVEEYKKAIGSIKAKDRALLLVRRKGEDLFVTIRPE